MCSHWFPFWVPIISDSTDSKVCCSLLFFSEVQGEAGTDTDHKFLCTKYDNQISCFYHDLENSPILGGHLGNGDSTDNKVYLLNFNIIE